MKTDSFLKLIKENWIFIVVIVQFLYNVFTLQDGFDNHENRIVQLEKNQASEVLVISEINSRLASIETSLVFIKEILQ